MFAFGACVTQVGTLPLEGEVSTSPTKEFVGDHYPQKEEDPASCGFEEIVLEAPNGEKKKMIIPLQCEEPPVDSVCDPEETFKKDGKDIIQFFDSSSQAL